MISLSSGDTIAGYRLERVVGRGGMGVVFRATHIALERQGAVKLIAPELAQNEEFRRRFQLESKQAASIDHPHVIPIFDAGDEGGQLYVAMRYVEGTDLRDLIAHEGRLDVAPAVRMIAEVADALGAAHARGLVHRDVKPANVLLEPRPSGLHHTYLTDFGLVKTIGATSGPMTRTGQWLGTPDYAAPEQVMGGDVDGRTDIYALGCMLYQMVTGKPPFEGDTDVAKLFAHVSNPPPSLADGRPDAPPGLDAVVQTALAKDPADRYDRAGDLAAAAGAAIGAPATTSERAPMPATPVPTPAPRARPDGGAGGRGGSRRRSVAIVAAAGVLAGAAAIAVVAAGGGDDGSSGAGGGGSSGGAVIPDSNLTPNPSFESDSSGWDVFNSQIARERAADAPNGKYVARVSVKGSADEYAIDDLPDTVSSSRVGRVYTASAWVKTTPENDGEEVCISIRERGAGDGVSHSDLAVKASADEFRQLRVSHRAEASGARIDVHLYRADSVAAGEAFLTDAITLTDDGQPSGPRSTEC